MIAVRHRHKIHVHQPFAAPGAVFATREHQQIGAGVRGERIALALQHFGQLYLGGRMLALELAQNGEQRLAREDIVDHQLKPRAGAVAKRGGVRLHPAKGAEQRAHLRQQQFACGRQHRAAAPGLQQRHAETLLQQRQVIAHRRLAAVRAVRRPRETAFFHHFVQQGPLFQRCFMHNSSNF
ncbi:hypothetical protein BN133_2529 [Cronobacter dublinensis 582]|nr:hypothetical protein BN133_2529 [Cronobacter dublinensis 582]